MSGNAQLPGKKTAAGSPEIYQRLFETAPDGILLLQHENGRIFDANPYLSTMLGYSKEELLGKHLWELETAGDTSLSRIMFEEAKGGKYSHCDEIILETKEGGAVHAELDSTVFEASEGKVVQCTVRTIPDNILHGKEDEKNLKKYERFIQNIQGIAYQSTMNWIPIFFQGSVKEITGYTKTELFSGDITWDKIMVPEDLAAIGDKIKDLGTIPGFSVDRDYRIKRKDGEIRWVHDSIQNVCDDTGKPAFLQGIIYDITDRKSTELALKSSEEKYRLLAESADDIIFTLDSEGNFVYINNYGADMLGLPADRIISRSYTDVMPPELLTKMESLIAELTGPDEPLQRECQCQDRIIDMKVIAVRIPDIKKQGYLFIGRDISSRKKAELALRETFSLLNAALESTEDGILVINLQGKITHYNKKFTTIWNIPDQVLETGQDSVALDYVMSDIVDPDAFIRKVRYLYQHPGEESFDTFAFKDGTVIERFSKPQYLDGTIVGRVWSFRNVSGIYQIKEVLEQVNKKLHLLSEVTRHDILNEVGIIIGYLDLLGDALPDDPALKKDVPADPRCDRAHPEKDNLHPGLPATRSQSPAVAGSPENRRA